MARSNGTGGSSFSIIGDGITITGNIDSRVDLHIDGEVIGDIKCLSLVQGPSSKIQGAIIAQNASLSGSVEGSIESGDLVISSTARISGDVAYENVTIEQGGHVDGKFKHKSAKLPNMAKTTVDMKSASPPLELTEGDKAA
ncbi:bactofilin family protein [Parasphingorhabdus halotolerans]|uniref:bactofilin family protein n=1 Tax=Parasphingorhabdus halotolerans TaxID=2725558 RepID=UPI001FE8EFE5|nr:polymer-forming cytoskeletal protein [Parasphingorhabdus halotolerans]